MDGGAAEIAGKPLPYVDARSRELATAPSAARVVNQVLMNVETWGESFDRGGRSMNWTELLVELEAQLGGAPRRRCWRDHALRPRPRHRGEIA